MKVENFFKDKIKVFRKKYKCDYMRSAFIEGIKLIENEYKFYGGDYYNDDYEIKNTLIRMNKDCWHSHKIFCMHKSECRDFFKKNCIGIMEIYREMQKSSTTFCLEYEGNKAYIGMILHLQNYCFDFLIWDLE